MSKEAVVTTLNGEPVRAEFPMRITVFGIEAVVIPEVDYLALTAAVRTRGAMAEARAALARPRHGCREPLPHTVERDGEIATFLRERFKRPGTLQAIEGECVERFGPERTPSTSRISSFRIRVREGG